MVGVDGPVDQVGREAFQYLGAGVNIGGTTTGVQAEGKEIPAVVEVVVGNEDCFDCILFLQRQPRGQAPGVHGQNIVNKK